MPVIKADVECDISEDNSTWVNIKSILYGGCIDENNTMANIPNLNDDFLYYIRCKNSTTEYSYLIQRTKGARESDIYYIYSTMLLLFLLLLGIGYYTEDWVFHVIGGLMIIPVCVYLFNNEFLNLTNVFLKNGLIIVLAGIGLYFILHPSMKLWEDWT